MLLIIIQLVDSPTGLSTSPLVAEGLRAASKGLRPVSAYGPTSQIVTHSWYGPTPQTSPSSVLFSPYADYRNSTRPCLSGLTTSIKTCSDTLCCKEPVSDWEGTPTSILAYVYNLISSIRSPN